MALKKRAGNDRRAVQNAMKTLLANIRFASVDKPIQTLAVTSSKPKEGKVDHGMQFGSSNCIEWC